MPENNDLSERELEILELVATGASNKEIANQLYISSNTVKVHLRNIFTKIGANSRTEAAMYALQQGLIESPGMGAEGEDAHGELSMSSTRKEASPWLVYGRWVGLIALILVFLVGSVLISGGQSGSGTEGNNQISTDTLARWEEKLALPTARKGLGVVAYENMIYTIAGTSDQGVTDVLERFDPQEEKWTTLSSKPTSVMDVSAAATGGEIIVPGGRTASGDISSVVEVYDIQEDRWEKRAPMPSGLSAYALTAFEGKLYLFGGWNGQSYTNQVYEYDPSNDLWQEKTPMSMARGFAGAVEAGGGIYVIGGYDGERALSINERYMANRDNGQDYPWEVAAPLAEGRYAMGIASVSDIVHIIGGLGNPGEVLGPVGYFPQQDAWQDFDMPISQNWSYMGAAPIGGDLYLLGGEIGNSITDKTLSYRAIYTISLPILSQD